MVYNVPWVHPDRQTDRRYQVHYLPRFAVDKHENWDCGSQVSLGVLDAPLVPVDGHLLVNQTSVAECHQQHQHRGIKLFATLFIQFVKKWEIYSDMENFVFTQKYINTFQQ